MQQIVKPDGSLASILGAPLGEGPNRVRTDWFCKVTDFQSGMREVCLYKQNIIPGTLSKKRWSVRRVAGELSESSLDESVKRSRKAVRQHLKSIGADYMVTLTVRENLTDMDEMARRYDLFRRRVSKVQNFAYCAIPELQVRGAIHLHIGVKGRQNLRLLRSVWQSINGGKGQASVHIRSPFKEKGLRSRLAEYMCKYMGKEFDTERFNKKRYWASRNIPKPVVSNWLAFSSHGDIPLEEIVLVGFELVSDRAYKFYHRYDCFWLSAAPPGTVGAYDKPSDFMS